MKNIITVLLCCLLTVDTALHGMLYVPSDSSSTIQRIPLMSLERIGLYIETLPIKKSTAIKKQLSHSLTFNVALLPTEIKRQIILYMFNANETIAAEYYKKPLLHLCTELHQSKKIISNSSLYKEQENSAAQHFMTLPINQREIINNVINPSLSIRLAYSGPIISEETLATLDKTTANIFFNNQDIIKVQKLEETNPLAAYVFSCLVLTSFLSTSSAVGIYAIPFITCFFFNYCPNLSPTLSVASSVTKLLALCWLIYISTTIRKRDKNKKIVLQT